MPIFRVSFGINGPGIGWAETHAFSIAQNTALGCVPLLAGVARARAAFLARDYAVVGMRISIYSDGGAPPSRLARNTWPDKTKYGNGGRTQAWAGEPRPVALQAIGIASAVGTPDKFLGNKNTTFLGGPTDTMVTDAGTVVPEANNLQPLFDAWKAAMIQAGAGWLNVVPLLKNDIATIIQNDDATVTFTVVPPADASLVIGKTYPIRVSRINGGRSPLNRALNAKYTAANTFKTIEQIAFALDQANGVLVPYQNVNGFIPYGNIVLGAVTVEHKRGKPFFSEPGRARKEIRA